MQQQFETDIHEQNDFYNQMQEKEIPSSLNVLTILTFVGCAIGAIGGIYSFFTAQTSLDTMKELMADKEKMEQMPEFAKKMYSPEMIDLLQKQVDYKLPILILGMLSVALCFWGALEMRKCKMNGYYYWLIGEILPIIGSFIFTGFAVYKGFAAIGILFPLIFIILYTLQRKHLNK